MTYYFYDLETSGLNPRRSRIMQFAGQRTDENLNPIGKPHNILVKLTDDVLPEPDAILVTGITPQKTLEKGISEIEFLRILNDEVFIPNTTISGFNNISFDDEFIRFTNWRNFYDAYEWHWLDGRKRFDVLHLVWITRALRPDGIKWPFDKDKKAVNRLEILAKENKLEHNHAHDALSDVNATIALARLIKDKQPKLFDYLIKMTDKKNCSEILNLNNPQPVVHSSGRISSNYKKTSVVFPIAPHPVYPSSLLVYDLRFNPTEFADLSIEELEKRAFTPHNRLKEDSKNRLPVKAIHLNKSPAIAPIGVLNDEAQENIDLTLEKVYKNLEILKSFIGFGDKMSSVFQTEDKTASPDADTALYDGFINDSSDKQKMRQVRNLNEDQLADFDPGFKDERLSELLLRFKARNYPSSLSQREELIWESVRTELLTSGKGNFTFSQFYKRIAELEDQPQTDTRRQILSDLKEYADSIKPHEPISFNI